VKFQSALDLLQSFRRGWRSLIGRSVKASSSHLYLALLLSVALHWSAFLLVGTSTGSTGIGWQRQDSRQQDLIRIRLVAQASTATVVHLESTAALLLPIGQTVTDVVAPVQGKVVGAEPVVLQPEFAMPLNPQRAASHDVASQPAVPDVDEPQLLEIDSPPAYYFKAWELSAQPLVLSDSSADQVRELSESAPEPLIAHLLINEDGTIDQIVFEPTSLSDEAKQFVIDAFSKTRFSPGKLGDQPVKTDLTIEIRLDVVPNQ